MKVCVHLPVILKEWYSNHSLYLQRQPRRLLGKGNTISYTKPSISGAKNRTKKKNLFTSKGYLQKSHTKHWLNQTWATTPFKRNMRIGSYWKDTFVEMKKTSTVPNLLLADICLLSCLFHVAYVSYIMIPSPMAFFPPSVVLPLGESGKTTISWVDFHKIQNKRGGFALESLNSWNTKMEVWTEDDVPPSIGWLLGFLC